eukprot:scaffold1564_cov389-Prasinococcus_capsulatus_cf.AAC.7
MGVHRPRRPRSIRGDLARFQAPVIPLTLAVAPLASARPGSPHASGRTSSCLVAKIVDGGPPGRHARAAGLLRPGPRDEMLALALPPGDRHRRTASPGQGSGVLLRNIHSNRRTRKKRPDARGISSTAPPHLHFVRRIGKHCWRWAFGAGRFCLGHLSDGEGSTSGFRLGVPNLRGIALALWPHKYLVTLAKKQNNWRANASLGEAKQKHNTMVKFSNVVRFVVKPGKEKELEAAFTREFDGMVHSYLIKTGEREYVTVGLWESEEHIAAQRPAMISFLDELRDMLEELSPELGVTDPRSGPIVASV